METLTFLRIAVAPSCLAVKVTEGIESHRPVVQWIGHSELAFFKGRPIKLTEDAGSSPAGTPTGYYVKAVSHNNILCQFGALLGQQTAQKINQTVLQDVLP